MARTVFLHIGTMKSATTYLQGLCDLNSDRLAESGVLWPSVATSVLALADFRGTKDTERPGREGAWRRLVERVQEHPADVLLSNELMAPLSGAKIRHLTDALRPARLEVIVTARDLGRVIPSQWQTTLKNGSQMPWAEFAAVVCRDPKPDEEASGAADLWTWFWRRHDVPAILRKWKAMGRPKQLTVVTVPPSGSTSQLVAQRFASAVGFESTSLQQPDRTNSTVGAQSAELMRRLNVEVGEGSRNFYRWGIKEALAVVLEERAAGEPRIVLDAAQLKWAGARAQRMIEELRRSSARVVGDLDDLVPRAAMAHMLADPAATSEQELLEAAIFALAGVTKIAADLALERESRLWADR